MKLRKGWRMSCDVGKATEVLENELWCRWNYGKVGEWAELIIESFRHFTYVKFILQSFHRFTYVTVHSPTLPLLHLCHSSFSNLSFASSTSQALHLIHLASRPRTASTVISESIDMDIRGCRTLASFKRLVNNLLLFSVKNWIITL